MKTFLVKRTVYLMDVSTYIFSVVYRYIYFSSLHRCSWYNPRGPLQFKCNLSSIIDEK